MTWRHMSDSFVVLFLCCCLLVGAAPACAQTSSVPVATLDNPQQLATLDVVDPNGAPIGRVVKVKTGSDGKASRVMVMLSFADGMGRVAAIRPERLSLDKARGVVVAQYTSAEVTQLAATATTPSGIDVGRSSGLVARPSGY